MIEKILFGAIGVFMLGIVAVGAFALLNGTNKGSAVNPVVETPTTATSAQSPTPTQSTQSAPAPGTFTMAQVATHHSRTSCYTAINGSVYDLTAFIDQHPGGAAAILSLCGTDGTAAFEAQHGGQGRPERELAQLKIGTLSK